MNIGHELCLVILSVYTLLGDFLSLLPGILILRILLAGNLAGIMILGGDLTLMENVKSLTAHTRV